MTRVPDRATTIPSTRTDHESPECPRCGGPSRKDPDWPDSVLLCDTCADTGEGGPHDVPYQYRKI